MLNGLALSALVDSGNTYLSAISLNIFLRLGFTKHDIEPVPDLRLETAKSSQTLKVLGKPKQKLRLQFANCPAHFRIKPLIIADLSMDANISGPFLKSYKIVQDHGADALVINGHSVPLHERPLPVAEKPKGRARVAATTFLPPFSAAFVPLVVSEIAAGDMPPGDGILEGGDSHNDLNAVAEYCDLIPAAGVLASVGSDGKFYSSALNPTGEMQEVQQGADFGVFRLTCGREPAEATPWRVCMMEASCEKEEKAKVASSDAKRGGEKGTTLREKLREAIRKAKEAKDKPEEKEEYVDVDRWSKKRLAQWLQKNFRLEEAPCLRTEEDRQKAVELLLRFIDVISVNGEYGDTKLLQHEIHTEDALPIRCKHRPINPALEGDLKKQLEKWEKHGVIERSSSPWSFPLVAAPKKGGKIRWCVDYRLLNSKTVKDSHPIPSISDNIGRLSRSRIFSCVDGSGAFHVISIKKDHRPKTSFSTPWGSFQYCKLPFGLCNGPATYSRLVTMVLNGVPGEVALPYLDDAVIHSKDLPGHFRNLTQVLERYRTAGLKLQPEKCHLFRPEVEYLGHLVGQEGVRPLPDYIKAVKEWPMPTNKTQVRTFLGKVGYYRRFIKGYSAIAEPWTSVAGKEGEGSDKKEPVEVTEAMKKSFHELKSRLLAAPILAYPRFDSDEPFILDTDWSGESNSIGATLSQVQDGKERVIAYGAKKLGQSQANYNATKGELVAILYFTKHYRYYLQHRPFLVRTDHQPLVHIRTMEPPDAVCRRWLDTLANYDFKVAYRPGKRHGNADGLSRAPHIAAQPGGQTEIGTDEEEEEKECRQASLVAVAVAGLDHWKSPQKMKEAQENDETLGTVLEWLQQGKTSADFESLERRSMTRDQAHYNAQLGMLKIDSDGVIRRRQPNEEHLFPWRKDRWLPCLPEELWPVACRVAHEHLGHLGVDRSLHLLANQVYFPHAKQEMTAVIAGCEACQRKVRKAKDQRGLLMSAPAGHPFQRISVDFVGPLQTSRYGRKYILTMQDTFSKWIEGVPLRSATAKAAAVALEQHIFCRFGVPDIIHSDQGAQFTCDAFKECMAEFGVLCTTTPAYNPKSNPVERAHRTLGSILRALLLDSNHDWESVLPHALFAMNSARSEATGTSPFETLFGHPPTTPLSILFGAPSHPPDVAKTFHEQLHKHRRRIEQVHKYVREKLRAAVVRQRQRYNMQAPAFKVGAKVWLFTPTVEEGASRKLSSYYTGPYTILRKINELMYEIQPPAHWNMRRQSMEVSVDRLRLYVPAVGQPDVPPMPHQDLLMHGDPHAEGPIPPPPDEEQPVGSWPGPVPPPPFRWPDGGLDDWFLRGFGMDEDGNYEPVYVEPAEQLRRRQDRAARQEKTPKGDPQHKRRWARQTPEEAAAADDGDSPLGMRRGMLRPRPLNFTPAQDDRDIDEESATEFYTPRADRTSPEESAPDLAEGAAPTPPRRPQRHRKLPVRFSEFVLPGYRRRKQEDPEPEIDSAQHGEEKGEKEKPRRRDEDDEEEGQGGAGALPGFLNLKALSKLFSRE